MRYDTSAIHPWYDIRFSFSMHYIPDELWIMIFRLVCLDGGTTGRRLSLVSKYIHEVSKPVKFQSIILRGFNETVAFLSLLRATPQRHICIYHLFVYEDCGCYTLHRSLTAPLNRILLIVGPALRTLVIRFDHSLTRPLFPLILPVLEELTIFSASDEHVLPYTEPIKPLPCLKRIHYAGRFAQHGGAMFSNLCEMAPNFTHFRYTGLKALNEVVMQLEAVSGWGRQSSSQLITLNESARLPSTVVTIIMQEETEGWYNDVSHFPQMMDVLRRRGRERGVVVAVLPPVPARVYCRGWEMKAEWLDRIGGGQGCWCETSESSVIQSHCFELLADIDVAIG